MKTTIGATAISTMKISPSSKTSARTYRHELGHALGLMHEHQRWDRDSYVIVSGNDINNRIIPKQTVVAGLQPVRINLWFTTITIYLPYVWYLDYGKTVGSFDWNSVMLYSGIKIKGSTSLTKYNEAISTTDVSTVKQMY
jgi:hypothetical protein